MLFGYKNVDGEISTPASAPIRPASAQPRVRTRPTLIPSKRATAGSNAAARIRRPTGVYLNNAASSNAATRTEPLTNRSLRDRSMGAEPTLSPVMENAAGNERNWPP
jgi:hypothetical protein